MLYLNSKEKVLIQKIEYGGIKMNNLKIGIALIILGNLLYIVNTLVSNSSSSIGDFTSGILLGISIGVNLIGIVLTVASSRSK